MEAQARNTAHFCQRLSFNGGGSFPDCLPLDSHGDRPDVLIRHIPGMIIPNRIFVGGIDYKVTESHLRHIFSQHGTVKEAKIVIDHSGMSKGYGFVTFETQEDVVKILSKTNGILFKDKKLFIGQAVRKYQTSGQPAAPAGAFISAPDPAAAPRDMSCGTFYLTTSTGFPYTYHNGVAYFNCPSMNQAARHWTPAPALMLPQPHLPVYHPAPAYYPCQAFPQPYPWDAMQVPVPSSTVVYSQQTEYLYQLADGVSLLPPAPMMEDGAAQFVDSSVSHMYPDVPPLLLQQHCPVKNMRSPPA